MVFKYNQSSLRNSLLSDKNVDSSRSYMDGAAVCSIFSYSREDRCVVTADVHSGVTWCKSRHGENTHTHTEGIFLDAFMRDDELSLQFPAQLALPLSLWPPGQKG